MHAVTRVRLIASVGVHGLPVRHATQRGGQLDAHMGEGVLQDILKKADGAVHIDERHLEVDLGELRLTISAQVLVAEALGNLVVALNTAHHEQLLEQLGRLGKSIEVAGLDAARDDEIASALRRGLEQDGRLDLEEGTIVQSLAHAPAEGVAHFEVVEHLRTAQVQVAVAQTRVLGGIDAILDLEGRGLARVDHLDVGDKDLDLAGDHVGVRGVVRTMAHCTGDGDGPLGTDGLGGVERLGARKLRVERALRETLTVAQVDENETAVVAAVLHPTIQRDGSANVAGAQLATGVGVR